jgi:hypothetical protein
MAIDTVASSQVALHHAPHPVLRVLSYFLLAWSRLWRGTLFTGFVAPLLYLGAIGFGLGSLIDAPGSNPLGVPFLQFVAPGVLAATAMQIGAFEATYPVLGAIKWQRNYHAMLATPLSSDHIVLGHLASSSCGAWWAPRCSWSSLRCSARWPRPGQSSRSSPLG